VNLDHEACYRVIQARDARYDGRLFVGVKTTGVYCRPVCPARTPRSANVRFFPSAAAAQQAGFRPCLRCRPEVAPDLAAWHGSSTTVMRALRLIAQGQSDDVGIERLAERLGIGARQLSRLFMKHVGASPGAVMRSRRIHLASQLIRETSLPLTQVAHAAGFGSVRRFNETFSDLFGRPPSSWRRSHRAGHDDLRSGLTMRLGYSRPYAWNAMMTFLAARAVPGMESVTDGEYVRSTSCKGAQGVIAVGPGRSGELTLRVHASTTDALPALVSRVRRMFDLGADARTVDRQLSVDPWLAPLVKKRPGLRVPGAWNGFELAVRAILGQQISVSAARDLAQHLVRAAGEPLSAELACLYPGVTHVFPEPAALGASALASLRLPKARAEAVQAIAAAVSRDPAILSQRSSLDESIASLVELPGIGSWTAHYIAMRELGEPDAFPARDAGLLRAAATLAGRRLSPAELLQRAERWRPWRAYAAMHLWASLRSADTELPSEYTNVA
jgi:AraC family transcriptional regulator of adaptative response / DNA-3-methyladenine glycosylase II